jgi:3-oxoacyl-[acyl-carrier-protein] synthase III
MPEAQKSLAHFETKDLFMIKKVFVFFVLLSTFHSLTSFAAVPTLALTFGTNVQTYGVTSTQETKIRTAEEKIKEVIGSEEFRLRVLNHTYNGIKTFVDNGGLTNGQIYLKILNAAEVLLPVSDNELDLGIKTYYQNSSTVGYTYSNSSYIFMNTKFLNQYNPNQVSRNMIHEWLHKLGFRHASYYTTSRNYSVPYAIGKIMEELAAKY